MQSNQPRDIDLDFRPKSYFWPTGLETHLLSRIKGAERKAALKQLGKWKTARKGEAIQRSFKFKDFSEAWGFMARVALLARDEASFREDLKATQGWIAKFFDARAKPTAAALATLKQISESPVAITVPDINASLAAVRTARAAREKR